MTEKNDAMRTFETGATRNSLDGKLSYKKALSPAVLRRYVSYLAAHRKQADGNLREFDNWKKGMNPAVYCDSLMRHTVDAWLVQLGHPQPPDGYDLQSLLCAIIFNASGWLFELLVAETGNRELDERDVAAIKETTAKSRTLARAIQEAKMSCGQCYWTTDETYGCVTKPPETDASQCSAFIPRETND